MIYMTREEADSNLIRKVCVKCKTTKYLTYSTSYIATIQKKHFYSSELTCSRCKCPCGAAIWERG